MIETKMNILDQIPENLPDEEFKKLLNSKNLTIERIVSKGHSSPESGWYDQDHAEWVILIKGRAELEFQGGQMLTMLPGDYINIPSRKKHRVAWTDPDQESVWLAVRYKD